MQAKKPANDIAQLLQYPPESLEKIARDCVSYIDSGIENTTNCQRGIAILNIQETLSGKLKPLCPILMQIENKKMGVGSYSEEEERNIPKSWGEAAERFVSSSSPLFKTMMLYAVLRSIEKTKPVHERKHCC